MNKKDTSFPGKRKGKDIELWLSRLEVANVHSKQPQRYEDGGKGVFDSDPLVINE